MPIQTEIPLGGERTSASPGHDLAERLSAITSPATPSRLPFDWFRLREVKRLRKQVRRRSRVIARLQTAQRLLFGTGTLAGLASIVALPIVISDMKGGGNLDWLQAVGHGAVVSALFSMVAAMVVSSGAERLVERNQQDQDSAEHLLEEHRIATGIRS